ncbi:MAG: hypothetical protein ABJC66_05485 [Gammaproteobacteria bacterium]
MHKTAFFRTAAIFAQGAATLFIGLPIISCLAACGRAPSGAVSVATASAGQTADTLSGRHSAPPLLTKEEVGAILGNTVTSVDGSATDTAYKTAVVGLEVSIDVEREDDAQLAMSGARKATGMLGGAPEEVPNLGEEAFFGAMSVLYVRRGDMVITITPPNLQLAAGVAAYDKVAEAKMGSAEQLQAMKELQSVEKTDPLMAGLKQRDDVQGAMAVINASSKKQGTSYETRARAIGVALATKVLAKL